MLLARFTALSRVCVIPSAKNNKRVSILTYSARNLYHSG